MFSMIDSCYNQSNLREGGFDMGVSRITLKDVAEDCGYTMNTVSRAGTPHLFSASRYIRLSGLNVPTKQL